MAIAGICAFDDNLFAFFDCFGVKDCGAVRNGECCDRDGDLLVEWHLLNNHLGHYTESLVGSTLPTQILVCIDHPPSRSDSLNYYFNPHLYLRHLLPYQR